MSSQVAIYQLNRKFVNRSEDIPENARQVVYYALAVGHHVGVMDCFSSLAEIPLGDFSRWLQSLPEGTARLKLEGILKWGEIEINRSHVGLLLPVLDAAEVEKPDWVVLLRQSLLNILQEPALYLMVRTR
jgi:hypothetical protein